MTEPKSIELVAATPDPSKEGNNLNQTSQIPDNSKALVIYEPPSSSLPVTIAKTTGSAALYVATSSIGRKAIFTGAMYLAGGTIVSTVGLGPVLIVGAVVWLM